MTVALAACDASEGPTGVAASPEISDEGPRTAEPPAAPIAEQATAPATPTSAAGDTVGGDGSQIVLEGLAPEHLESVELAGELACGFADTEGRSLLVAKADVVPDGAVRAVVNHNGYVELLGNGRAGGFNDLSDGITLSGKGLTLVLERGERVPTGNESTEHAATLKVQRADGAERVYPGKWTCGP